MISGVTREIDGEAHTFRMSSRAMMAIEDRCGVGIVEVLEGFDTGFRVTDVVRIFAECDNDGAGVPTDKAQALVDRMGLTEAVEVVGKISEAAFPEAVQEKKETRPKRQTKK